jgi:hypothetical protein
VGFKRVSTVPSHSYGVMEPLPNSFLWTGNPYGIVS